MVDKDWSDTDTLIMCDNEKCDSYSLESELEQNDWKCPFCGKQVLKPQLPPSP
jgi:PHP family Zn ribbon phosphoesterase